MDENQIDLVIYHNLKDKRHFFKGTFASNELVPLKRLEPGTHSFHSGIPKELAFLEIWIVL